ncbi:MAG: 1,4-alpha-glucan branching protein GlgB [Clostridiales Family XIII bacterium]|jgi:1,4-alpha-glucan branching enzyme|nr:1,4-alpha-glucan branching protein GlgB [Clostridiales Family XIII bacterium]
MGNAEIKAAEYYLDDAEISAFYDGTNIDADAIFGCHYISSEKAFRFCVWAPNAQSISVVGDFCDWEENAFPMKQYRGIWVAFVPEAKQGENYKYLITGADGEKVYKADPFAYYSETPPETASVVWDIGGYEWNDGGYVSSRDRTDIQRSPISIYEMHFASWLGEDYDPDERVYPKFRDLARGLAKYLKEMGFTHVELMPISEHPFDGSWGYQVTGFFAITSRFGTPQDFMYFVDTLHGEGIGVIVDWVPAHFPKDKHGLPHFDGTWLFEHANPLRREHPQWGTYEFNYNRPEVVSFLISSAVLLFEKYHVDGIRVDAVSSMLYLDYGREGAFVPNKDGGNIDYEAADFLRKLNTAILGGHAGRMTVAEESTAFPLVTGSPKDGGLGFTFKWNMGFMHDTLGYMSTDPYFRSGSHDKMTFSMQYAFSENFILPYSHDEVVHGKASMIGKMFGNYEEKFEALKTLYAFLFAHPGKKLLFMGDEFGQFIEWNYKQQLDWLLLDYDTHRGLHNFVKELNHFYTGHGAFFEVDDSWDGFRWLNVEDRTNSVFAFMRIGKGLDHEKVVCVFNFTPVLHEDYYVALPENGTLRLLLASDDVGFGGVKTGAYETASAKEVYLNGMPYAALLAVPPNSALYYEYEVVDCGSYPVGAHSPQ